MGVVCVGWGGWGCDLMSTSVHDARHDAHHSLDTVSASPARVSGPAILFPVARASSIGRAHHSHGANDHKLNARTARRKMPQRRKLLSSVRTSGQILCRSAEPRRCGGSDAGLGPYVEGRRQALLAYAEPDTWQFGEADTHFTPSHTGAGPYCNYGVSTVQLF